MELVSVVISRILFSHLLTIYLTLLAIQTNGSLIIQYIRHLVVLYIFLKTGLIGLIVWLIIFYKVSIGKILILKKMKNTSTIMLTGLASSISILIYFKSFNSKLQFITGLLLYVICSSKNIDHEF